MARNTNFNEDGRVKYPAMVHLIRLGYHYFKLSDPSMNLDPENNILQAVFKRQFLKLNPDATENDFDREYKNIKVSLNNDDLGRDFFNRIQGRGDSNSTYTLIDWENFAQNNTFDFTMEVPCKNGDDEFRPDIMIFINGLPLSYIEVKRPGAVRGGTTGMKSEAQRMERRFQNKKFRAFHNITQMISFTDNSDYCPSDEGSQSQGSYYCTTSKGKAFFNSMHEERKGELLDQLHDISDEELTTFLKQINKITLKNSKEFQMNIKPETYANQFISSMYTKDRLGFFLHFGITYVNNPDGLQKHIMRYPQYFATRAIKDTLDKGIKKGIIWHSQGSGKTALAYFNVRYLTHYYQQQNIVPHFYFLVDRIDLASQAHTEFTKRGLNVRLVSSPDDLVKPLSNEDIAVVNIQKFTENTNLTDRSGYKKNEQNFFFIDEAHRSYNEKGSYLAHLYNADKESIKIALTGTPLIKIGNGKAKHATTRDIFGDYIHKYYYNQSIEDGYTLRLIREEIATEYKEKLQNAIDNMEKEVKKGSLKKDMLYSHPNYVNPMTEYIIKDFVKFREINNDSSVGGMIVAESSNQARALFQRFNDLLAAGKTDLKVALILSDKDDKETRKKERDSFKDGKIDLLIVYNMLLTGFDAHRLKKMYLGRKLRAHNLMQALTRVNRPYKNYPVGYIVDFANISSEFDKTNEAYAQEFNKEFSYNQTGVDPKDAFGNLFVSADEIQRKLQDAENVLMDYPTNNLETFSRLVQQETDLKQLRNLNRSLKTLKESYNLSSLLGYRDLVEQISAYDLGHLSQMVGERLTTLNIMNNLMDIDSGTALKLALDQVEFKFIKRGQSELDLAANDVQESQHRVAAELGHNFDPKDPEYITLLEELKRVIANQNMTNITVDELHVNATRFDDIYKKAKALNLRNARLAANFNDDPKPVRVIKAYHRKQTGKPLERASKEADLIRVFQFSKEQLDDKVATNENMVANDSYFNKEAVSTMAQATFQNHFKLPPQTIRELSDMLTDEYLDEYNEYAGVY